jgi:hypothetical protein
MDSENTLMTEITIRDYTAENSLVYYSIKVGDWEMDDHSTTLEGAFTLIKNHLKWDYREYERDLEYQRELDESE